LRTIAHISDLHFGRVDPAIPPILSATIAAAAPDILVVSGDLTQRAKRTEFAQAREFLDSLPYPKIVVPGNHDIPFYDVIRRWLRPLTRYRDIITNDLAPFYADAEIAVLGLNTARSLTFKNGRLNAQQLTEACRKFADVPPECVRIVATHHPFALADDNHDVVGRSELAMAKFSECGVDIILSGHMHTSHAVVSTQRYTQAHRRALLVQAGTATSTRQRGETNSFNILRFDGNRLALKHMSLRDNKFTPALTRKFVRDADGWTPVEEAPIE
jgi:3',5'-cyclic AMP phosphodiesterase CpdA